MKTTIVTFTQETRVLNYPNIFTSQSKEFTQDAFIDWLLRCADPGNTDVATRDLGQNFIRLVIGKHNALVEALDNSAANVHELTAVDPNIPFNEVLSLRQFLRIDVMGRVNGGGGLYIIFENKLGTEIHHAQVLRYRTDLHDVLREKYGEGKGQIIGVYYKVLEERDYEEVQRKYHYCTLSRQEMRDFLSAHTATNPIIHMYHDYLDELDRNIHQWKNLTITEMEHEDNARWSFWSGWFSELYQELKSRLKDDARSTAGWGWINNVAGGFHGLWMGNWSEGHPTVYLQCDERELKVRMTGPRTAAAMHDAWSDVSGKMVQASKREKAGRMQHNAQSAEIGNLGSYIKPDQDGKPSVPLTADYLMKAFGAVKEVTDTIREESSIPVTNDDAQT